MGQAPEIILSDNSSLWGWNNTSLQKPRVKKTIPLCEPHRIQGKYPANGESNITGKTSATERSENPEGVSREKTPRRKSTVGKSIADFEIYFGFGGTHYPPPPPTGRTELTIQSI